jgi:hypothetical protein
MRGTFDSDYWFQPYSLLQTVNWLPNNGGSAA